ncbi:unnamed protein product [Brassica oleracea]|uniref:(rape) hypothetical protein n=1 Tax=Brassica napus TaxID=3708 RepID=A0A816KT97_BRANA|nr:unnamed protein product [Brassica napus]
MRHRSRDRTCYAARAVHAGERARVHAGERARKPRAESHRKRSFLIDSDKQKPHHQSEYTISI